MSNKELVELCKKGDEQALSLLYKTYASEMMRICVSYVKDRQAAQDILHDGFIVIFSSIHTLKSPTKLKWWMGKIMRNLSLHYLEQRDAINMVPLNEIYNLEEPVDYESLGEFPPYDVMMQLIESLPEGYCKIFKLAVLDGMSHKEIGLLLHIAPHSSSSQLSRAKEMLKRLLSEYRKAGLLLLLFALALCIFRVGRKNRTEELLSADRQKDLIPQNAYISRKDTADTKNRPIMLNQDRSELTVTDVTLSDVIHSACQDSIKEKNDTSAIPGMKMENEVRGDNFNIADTGMPLNFNADKAKQWTFSVSYYGIKNQTSIQQTTITGGITSEEPKVVSEESHHSVPVVLSFSMQKKINLRWGIETGIQYSQLNSKFTLNDDIQTERLQKIHYIGIPLKGNCNVWNNGRFSIYTSAGLTLDIPLKASVNESLFSNEQLIMEEKHDLQPSLQWSINVGLGFQYQITPTLGIYAEPSLHYYFNPGDGVRTIRTETPLNTSFPIGIRLSW